MKTIYSFSTRKIFPLFLLLLCVLSSAPETSKAQLSNYVFTTGSGTRTSISGTALWTGGYHRSTNMASSAISIGFNFVLDGTVYTQFIVYPSGMITLGSTQSNTIQNNNLAGVNVPTIAGWWDNIGMSNGANTWYGCGTTPKISYQLTGTAPDRVMVIDFAGISTDRVTEGYYGEALSTWQIRLVEKFSKIELYYQNMTSYTGCGGWGGTNNSTTASIGVAKTSSNFISITPTGGTNATRSSVTSNNNVNLQATAIQSGTLYTMYIIPPNVQLYVQPKTLSFGSVGVGQSATQTFTVTHVGTQATLNIKSVSITGSPNFSIISSPPSNSYAVGQSGTYTVQFAPTTSGIKSALLTVVSDGLDSGTQTIALNGVGLVADMTVDSVVRFKKTRTRLGDSLTQWVHILSTGQTPLIFSSITIIGADAGQYFLKYVPGPIPPGVMDSIGITYVPTIEGKHVATLRLISNSFTYPVLDISLQGTGTLPHIVVTPALLLFDSTVREGDTVCKTISIWNPGSDTLKIFKNFLNSNDGDFTYYGLTGTDTLIAPDHTKTVTVCFSPKQQGTRQARLLLVTNIINTFETPRRDTARIVTVDIRGTGIPFGVFGNAVSGSPFLDSAIVGVEVCRTDTLKNTGDADILVTSFTFTGGVFSQTGLPALPFLLKARSSIKFTLCGKPNKLGLIVGTLVFNGKTSGTSIAFSIPLGIFGQNSCATPTPGELFTGVILPNNGSDSSMCVWVHNCGDVPASYTGAISGAAAADYRITTVANPSPVVAPGDSVQFCVDYKPSAVGTSNAMLNFTSPTAPNVDVPLNGAAGCATLTSEVATVPNTGANGVNTFTFKITNTGSLPWVPGTAVIVGAGKGAYKVISVVPNPIPAGQDGIVTVEFHPPVGTEGDNFIAVISWPDGGPCEAAVVSVDVNGKSVVSSVAATASADGFILEQSYPNPSAGITNFTYTTPREAEVRISLVDLTGKLIRTLITGKVSEGMHKVNFDAQNLPSGSYVYVLESGSTRLTRQLILTK